MNAFELDELAQALDKSDRSWHEFLRVPALSMGIYRLAAGATDEQSPHQEDEVYYVLEGQAVIDVDGADRPVSRGTIIHVEPCVPHRFHSITRDLTVLVFFAPAETA